MSPYPLFVVAAGHELQQRLVEWETDVTTTTLSSSCEVMVVVVVAQCCS